MCFRTTRTPRGRYRRALCERELKQLVEELGLDPKDYSSHSGRRGGVTDGLAAGIPPALVQKLGRWDSNTFYGYFESELYDKAEVSLALGSLLGAEIE